MRRIWKRVVFVMALLAVAMQFVRPARTNPVSNRADALATRLNVPDDVVAVLDRACRDCHSNETRWPWYSNVAPVSWFVIDHVNHGRSHFNYSTWSSYDERKAADLLDESCRRAQRRDMPLGSYLIMHGSARLGDAEIRRLCGWIHETLNVER